MVPTITVFSLPDCISCTLTLRAFERRGITPTVVEMTEEMADEFRAQGAMAAPVVKTPELWWYGLRPDLIQEATNEYRRAEVGRADRNDRPRTLGASSP